MTLTGRIIVLGAIVGAGLMAGGIFARLRRSACFADAGGGHVAILDAGGVFMRCEDADGNPVEAAKCAGYTPCRAPASGRALAAALSGVWLADDGPELA
jgi:hypothetical protein